MPNDMCVRGLDGKWKKSFNRNREREQTQNSVNKQVKQQIISRL